jgi:hypothetical protein
MASRTNSSLLVFESSYNVSPGRFTLDTEEEGVSKPLERPLLTPLLVEGRGAVWPLDGPATAKFFAWRSSCAIEFVSEPGSFIVAWMGSAKCGLPMRCRLCARMSGVEVPELAVVLDKIDWGWLVE